MIPPTPVVSSTGRVTASGVGPGADLHFGARVGVEGVTGSSLTRIRLRRLSASVALVALGWSGALGPLGASGPLGVRPARADSVVVTDQSGFDAAVNSAIATGQPTTITAQGGGTFVAGPDWTLPGNAASLGLTFNTSPFDIGTIDGDSVVTLSTGTTLTVNTTSGSSAGRIEIGNGSGVNGTLNLSGGTVQINLADTSTAPATSIGRIWVGGGATNTTGGTGTLTMTAGELLYVANAGSLNYGGLAIGRGNGVVGDFNQSGGVVRFSSAGALDLGVSGGTGTYELSGDAVFDATSGGMTAYIGSRTSGAGGSGTASSGTLTISDNAQFSITTGSFANGTLTVGDSVASGTITQNGAGSVVTLGLRNPIKFGSDVSNYGTGGTGTYNLSAGTLTVQNVGGSAQLVFGASSGGTGTFNISGGSATVGTVLVLASTTGSTGTVNMTGGALTLSGTSYLNFGSGTGTFNLDGGTFTVGGTNGIRGTGAFNFGNGTLVVGSALTTANAMTLGSGKTATINTNGSTATLSGVISGSGSLAKTGSGTLTLSATNTFTGGLTLSGGAVSVAADGSLGDATIAPAFSGGALATTATFSTTRAMTLLAGGGTLSPASGTTLTVSGVLSGTGGLTKSDAGTLVLSGTNTYSGGTSIAAGTLQVASDAKLGNASGGLTFSGGTLATSASFSTARAVSLTGAGTFAPAASTTLTESGAISGNGSLTEAGAGTLILTGAATHTGGTAISSGTLQIGSGGTSGSISGDIVDNARLTFNRSDSVTYAGAISGTGALTKSGTGTLILTGTNTFTGGTTISQGKLQIGNGGTSGSIAGDISVSGNLDFNLSSDLTFAGVISGSGTGNIAKDGTGTLTLTGTNTYPGSTRINAGTLQVASMASLGFGASVFLAGGTWATTSSFSTTRAVSLTAGGGAVAPAADTVLTLSGAITGPAGTLTKAGAGTLQLSSTSNIYSGGTVITAGTLEVSSNLNLGDSSGGLTISGGTLSTTASMTAARAVSLTGSGAISPAASTYLTVSGDISGSGALNKTGDGTLVLSGTDTHTGGTTIASGTLQIGSAGGTGTLSGDVVDNGALVFSRYNDLTFGGALSGTGSLTKLGIGTLTMTGAATHTGGTTISLGTLQIGAGGTTGSIAGDIVDNGALVFDRSDAVTYAGALSGTGSLTQSGTGTLTLTGAATHTGGTTVTAGTLRIGAGGTAGSVSGDIVDNAALVFDRSDAVTYAGVVSGTGSLTQAGGGTLTLSGTSTLTGGTTVSAGGLNVTGSLAGDVTVASGARLSGTGQVGGTVHVQAGGTLVGTETAPLSLGALDLAASSNIAVVLGAPSTTAAFDVTGNLTLAGALNVIRDTGFATGLYRIFNYGGTLTNNGLAMANSGGLVGTLQTAVAGQVNLVVAAVGETLQAWNGTTVTATGTVAGGSGVWSAGTAQNWTNTDGAVPQSWLAGFALFQGAAGTVTVDAGSGAVATTGMQFVTSGYTVGGDALTLSGGVPVAIRVGDGTAGGAATVATIASVLTGTTGIEKTDLGTLILTGANTYTGGTTVTAGTLQIGAGGTAGSIVGNVFDNGALVFDRSDAVTFAGGISGSGSLTKAGAGTLTLTGAATHSGGTTVSGGTLQIGNGGTTGSITGSIVDNAALTFNRSDDVTFAGGISGSGSLTKAGAGTLTLTGTNSYSGGTTISAGTLQIGNGGTSGSIAGDIVDNAALTFNRSDAVTYGGAISGTGSLTKTGAGKLTLTGAATHTGGTTIVSGILQIGDGGTSGSITGDIVDNGQLLFYRSDAPGSGGGSQAGVGTVNNAGGTWGTVTLYGPGGVNYVGTGGAINAGSVIPVPSLLLRSAAPMLVQAANGQATDGVFSGAISGTGSLVQAGPGTLTLTGAASHTGGTTIAAGTLQIGNGGTTGSVAGDIVDNGALVFNRADTVTYAGVVSGTGSLTKTGAGTLILTGDSTYTGGTTISQGTLQIGDGGNTGSIVGNVVNNARLVFNRAGSYQFPGTITGSGTVAFAGGGTVNFTGSSGNGGSGGGFAGTVTVADSSFVLSRGSESGATYTIDLGGTISGVGTISGLSVAAGGTASPGYSPGTLTVTGGVSFLPGSTYKVDVTPAGDHDLIIASGAATLLGGTVAVNATAGSYAPTSSYTILQAAGGVTGRFDTVTSNLAFLTPSLGYGANDVILTLQRNDVGFVSLAGTANQRSVATAADTLGTGNPVYDALVNLTAPQAPAAFDSLSGEAYASAGAVMLQQSIHVRDAVGSRLGQALAPSTADPAAGPTTAALAPGFTPVAWFQGFGAWGNAWGDGNTATVSSGIAGGFGGVDVALDDHWRVGLLGGYSRSTLKVAARGSTGGIDNYDLGLYAGARYGDVGVRLGATQTWHDLDLKRTVAFGNYAGTNTAGYRASTTQVFGEASYAIHFDRVTAEPFAGLAYVHTGTGGPTERGSTSALAVDVRDMDTVLSSLGLRISGNLALSSDVTVRPNLSLAWQHGFGDVAPTATAAFTAGSPSFGVAGAPFARDSALIGAGLDVRLGSSATFSASYAGQFGRGVQSNAFKGRLTVSF